MKAQRNNTKECWCCSDASKKTEVRYCRTPTQPCDEKNIKERTQSKQTTVAKMICYDLIEFDDSAKRPSNRISAQCMVQV